MAFKYTLKVEEMESEQESTQEEIPGTAKPKSEPKKKVTAVLAGNDLGGMIDCAEKVQVHRYDKSAVLYLFEKEEGSEVEVKHWPGKGPKGTQAKREDAEAAKAPKPGREDR